VGGLCGSLSFISSPLKDGSFSLPLELARALHSFVGPQHSSPLSSVFRPSPYRLERASPLVQQKLGVTFLSTPAGAF